MAIQHNPLTKTETVIEHYSENDSTPVKYVCTTELEKGCNVPVDVFYREIPHPEFGNRYFGIYVNHEGRTMILNADRVEDLDFAMIPDENNDLHYSAFRHDYVSLSNGNFVDGGREYVRTNTMTYNYTVKDGDFVKIAIDN